MMRQAKFCWLVIFTCAVVSLIFICVMTGSPNRPTDNNNDRLQCTNSNITVTIFKRKESFLNPKDNIAVAEASSKHGFQWLREQVAVDAVVVDNKTNASLLEHLVFSESKRLEITCPQQVRMGRKEDGGWDVCIAGPYNIVKPCLVYSIGMGGEWSFDIMITSPQYGCYDFAYDPSLGKPDHRPNPRLWYYNTGLGCKDGVKRVKNQNWLLKTFPTLLRENDHTGVTIDILKMDIEYSEWDALEVMLANVSCLANVKQLMIEFHTREINTNATSSRDELTKYWRVLRGIYHLGFKLWNVWNNPSCNFRSRRLPK